MRQQSTSNSFISLPNHFGALVALFLTFVLTACGGDDRPVLPEPTSDYSGVGCEGNQCDGEAPELVELSILNQCNSQPLVALDDVVIVSLVGSESLMQPQITINGNSVTMNGPHKNWSGEYTITQADIDALGGQDNAVIPVTISFADPSGMSGSDIVIDANGNNLPSNLSSVRDLKLCTENCQCFPSSIEGEWENANVINAMGLGPFQGSTEWWRIDNADLEKRSCVFDDTYTFLKDESIRQGGGSFTHDMYDQSLGTTWTWLEAWASPSGQESCGDPSLLTLDGGSDYKWDGLDETNIPGNLNQSLSYKWSPETGQLLLFGEGAHIGIPRARNGTSAEFAGPASSIVYEVAQASYCGLKLDVQSTTDASGTVAWWHFELNRLSYVDDSGALVPVDGTDYCLVGPDGESGSDSSGGSGGSVGSDDADGVFTASFSEAFGGTAIGENSVYSFPTGAETWGGFANMNSDMYPLSFSEAGSISFKGSVPTGGSVEVRFRLEYLPHPDVDPAYDTAIVTVTGANEASYSVEIPPQPDTTFSSLIMYVVTQDVGVVVTDLQVTADEGSGSGGSDDSDGSDGSGGTAPEVPADNDNNLLSGNWTLAQTGSAVAIGPSLGNTSWWPQDAATVFDERACLFDDVYSFNDDTNGFSKDIQDATWIDPWQGADAAGCGTPVAPYDGSVASSYAYDADAGTLTLYGKGAHVGLGMITNGAEIGDIADAPDSITYIVTELTNSSMTLDIEVVTSTGSDAFWRIRLVCADDSCVGNNDEGSTAVGEVGGTAAFTGVFDGFLADAETNTFEWPTDAASWAGVANENQALYPIVVPENTQINFLASSAEPASVYFRLEYKPYPDVNPLYETDSVVVNGACQAYSINLPSQGNNTFESYLLFIEERDIPVTVSNVVIGGEVPVCPEADPVAPVITSGDSASIDENAGENQVVYTVTSDNPDATYMISEGDNALSIDASTGEVSLSINPDYETTAGYIFKVKATANDLDSDEQSVTLLVANLDESAPSITSGDVASSVRDNSGAGQVIYTAVADDSGDANAAMPITFTLTAESDSALSIDGATGEVSLADNPNYDAQSQYSFGVIATDGADNASDAQAVTLTINNPAVSPLSIAPSSSAANFSFTSENCDLTIDSEDNCQAPNVDGLTNYQSVYVSSSTMNVNEKVVTISYASNDDTTTGVGVKVFLIVVR